MDLGVLSTVSVVGRLAEPPVDDPIDEKDGTTLFLDVEGDDETLDVRVWVGGTQRQACRELLATGDLITAHGRLGHEGPGHDCAAWIIAQSIQFVTAEAI